MLYYLLPGCRCPTQRPLLHIQSISIVRDRIVSASRNRNWKGLVLTAEELLADGCRLGMDSHADMSCVGAHATILEVYEGQLCNVMPFNDAYAPLTNVRSVNAGFAYDTDDGSTYIIALNQALDFSESMYHSLLCPNQARLNGVIVDDCPKALDHNGTSSHE